MKAMFLDLDGVMVINSKFCKKDGNKWDVKLFDPKAVIVLNYIIQETGCEIIISSDWCRWHTLQEMRDIFAYNFVSKGPIGFTSAGGKMFGSDLEGGRASEIKQWVKTHIWKDDSTWVAVDDLNMDEQLYPNFVHCPNDNEGIKKTGIKEKIIKILNG